jgi:hypothetical protein
MGDVDKWAKLEEILRKVVREEIAYLGKKDKTKIKLVNGRWEGITPDIKMAMTEAYSAVDVDVQLKEAAAWCLLHPNDAPRSNFGAFLNSWMKKHQDRHAIRSIPFERPTEVKKKLCAYCDVVASGQVGGICATGGW